MTQTTGGDAPLVHGGDLGWLAEVYPDAPRPLLDLSTGVNPWPYDIGAMPTRVWTQLPQAADESVARGAVADALGVADPKAVALVPGSETALRRLPELFAPAEAAILEPTYATHAEIPVENINNIYIKYILSF